MFDLHSEFSSAPLQGVLMGFEIEIYPVLAFNGTAPVFHSAPAVSGHVHAGAERVISGIGGNGAILGQEGPWKKAKWNHPGLFQ